MMNSVIFISTLSILSIVWASPVYFPYYVASNLNFSSSVYQQVAGQNEDNFLVSPLSAQVILALSKSGARGQTAKELQQVLKLPQCQVCVNCIFGNLLKNLQEDHDHVLNIANKIYLKENYTIREEFAINAEKTYQATLENVNFAKKIEAAETVNQWVANETNNKIRNLIDPEILGNETRALLVNALYFKGNWSTPFLGYTTQKQNFYTFNETIEVDTMHVYEEYFHFYEKPNLKATFLELPIVGENVAMTIVLPEERDGLIELEKHIDEVLEAPTDKTTEMFTIAIPKFKMESRIDFKTILANLGVKTAFKEGQADFTKIAGEKGELFIDDVVQKTFLDVNESGIEAAAATYVVKIVNRNAEDPRDFIVNHPFLFFVKINGFVLFVGRVVVPYY